MSNPNIYKYGFGNRTKEKDDEVRAMGMKVRNENIGKPRIWTDEKIHEFIDEMLTLYKKILMDDDKINKDSSAKLKSETIRDMNNMMNRLLQFKEKYYPTVQKQINVNIDMTADAVIERLKNWKKSQLVIVGEEEENDEEEDSV